MVKKLYGLRKRMTALFTAFMIAVMSLVDCAVYRPMEAYAFAIAIPGVVALISDILLGFGVTYVVVDDVRKAVASINDYTSTKKKEISATGKVNMHYIANIRPSEGIRERSFELKSSDLDTAASVLDGTIAVEPGDVIPDGLVDTVRAWAVEKLGVSNLDGTIPNSTIQISMDDYLATVSGITYRAVTSSDGTIVELTATSPVYFSKQYDFSCYYYAKAGTVMTKRIIYPDDREDFVSTSSFGTQYDKTGYGRLQTYYPPLACWGSGYDGWIEAGYIPVNSSVFANGYMNVKVPYTEAPTVDVSYADSPAVVWNGVADPAETLQNQKSLTTEDARTEYIDRTLSTSKVDATSYNALNYMLFTIANHLGVDVVSSDIQDAFIADVYAEYISGTSAEKLEQADAIVQEFTVIDGNGPDNNDKDFRMINWLANAYLVALIANGLLEDGTPQLQAGTKIQNITLVDTLAPPDVDPTPTVSPTLDPDPDPNPDPKPDISLSGILDWLSKIYHAIISIPQHIKDIGTGILNLPDKFADSKLGQWVKSIPEILTGIKAKIELFPDAIRGIKTAIENIPGILSQGFTDFFTINTTQITASYEALSGAVSGKFSAVKQIKDIFANAGGNFDSVIPVFTMKVPPPLQPVFQAEEIVVMDLRPYADMFSWCRLILTAILWLAFGHWVMEQFDVQLHVG